MCTTFEIYYPENKIRKVHKHSIAPLEVFSETVAYITNVSKIGLLRMFANFVGRHPCWDLFLINYIKNRLQRSFVPVKKNL